MISSTRNHGDDLRNTQSHAAAYGGVPASQMPLRLETNEQHESHRSSKGSSSEETAIQHLARCEAFSIPPVHEFQHPDECQKVFVGSFEDNILIKKMW